jgi:hypothetical protein
VYPAEERVDALFDGAGVASNADLRLEARTLRGHCVIQLVSRTPHDDSFAAVLQPFADVGSLILGQSDGLLLEREPATNRQLAVA